MKLKEKEYRKKDLLEEKDKKVLLKRKAALAEVLGIWKDRKDLKIGEFSMIK